MHKVVIDVEELDPILNNQLVNYLIFEFKDYISLKTVIHVLNEVYPGDYKIVDWTDKDNVRNMSVHAEFKSLEDYMFWRLSIQ